jgi:hypothetical protein
MLKRYALPDFLEGRTSEAAYIRWLRRKAAAHVKRDRKRCDHEIMGEDYRLLIHDAVKRSGGRDHYTGEDLRWDLVSTYCNETSKAQRSVYKASMALLPTVDHVPGADGKYDFVICGWRTNDAKNDMSHDEFVALCRRVVEHHDQQVLS